MNMDIIWICVVMLGLACTILSNLLFAKKHPFWILGLVILNAGIFNLHFSFLSGHLGYLKGFYYPYSSLIITIGIYVFFKNLQTKTLSKRDRNILLLTLFEPIFITSLFIGRLLDPYFSSFLWEPLNNISKIIPQEYSGEPKNMVFRFQMIFFYIFAISFFVVFFKLRKILRDAEERHLSFFCTDSFSYYKWIRRLLTVFTVGCLYAVCLVVLNEFIFVPDNIKKTIYFAMGIFALGLFALGIYTPLRFGKEKDFNSFLEHIENSSNLTVVKTLDYKEDANVSTQVSNNVEKYKVRLINLLEDEQLYQDANLSMASLAEQMDTSTRTLSRIIKDGFDGNFFDLINTYRVEEVKINLLEESYAHYSILSIGLDAVFNSKSTFYNVFKKQTGMTPSQYRKQHN